MKKILLSMGLIALTMVTVAQCNHPGHAHQNHTYCPGLQPIFEDAFTFVPPPASFFSGERTATFVVNYNGFTPEAQAAFQYAVDIWASVLHSSVPIVINANYQSVAGNSLGFANANQLFDNFPNAPQPNTAYPVALANKLAGFDLNPNSHDISATFNSNYVWYFGTDGNCPAGQFDFITVVLHELGHGLGIAGSAVVAGGLGNWQLPVRVVYDKLIENGLGQNITTFTPNTAELAAQLTGNDLFWFGSNAVEANNQVKPKIHAPLTWSGGSSFSHLNEATFLIGDVNSLMTPFVQQAEANHFPGPVVIGMMKDMGWTLKSEAVCSGEEWVMALETDCNPEDTYWQLLDANGVPLMTLGTDTYQEAGMQLISLCLEPGSCYTLVLQDAGGNGLTGCAEDGSFAIFNALGEQIVILETANFGTDISFNFCVAGIEGCTDAEAINYNPEAQINDGSCFYDCELPSVIHEIICEGENPVQFTLLLNIDSLGIAAPYEVSIPELGQFFEVGIPGQSAFPDINVGTNLTISLTSLSFPVCTLNLQIPGICPTGIPENADVLDFDIFPNPFGDRLTVDVPEYGVFTLFDLTGKTQLTQNLVPGRNVIETSVLSSGFYSGFLRSDKSERTFKLVKSENE